MVDINNGEQEANQAKPEGEKSEEAAKETQPSWQDVVKLSGLDPEQYDSPEKLAKTYKDATRGLSDQGQKLKEAEDFKNTVTPLLKAVYGNPELYKQATAEVKKLLGHQETNDEETKVVQDPRVDGLENLEEQRIIDSFEEKSKISQKSEAEKETIRRELGSIMRNWLGPNSRPSLNQLSVMLSDAWDIYKVKNNVKEEEETPQYNLNLGFGTPRAAQAIIDKMDVSSLTPEEQKAAERMGITSEEYLKEKKSIMKA